MVEEKKKNIVIGKPREFKIITPGGQFQDILIIPYSIDDASYEVSIKKEGATPEIIEKAVRDDAAKFHSVEGKTLSL